MEIRDSYSRIGGWLIVPAIGLVLSPISLLFYISSEIMPAFTAVPLSETSGEFRTYLLLDLLLNLLVFAYTIVVAVLFFKRRRVAPKLVMSLYLLNLLFIIGERFVFMSLNELQWIIGIINGIVPSLIWIPYFLLSKRVQATFKV